MSKHTPGPWTSDPDNFVGKVNALGTGVPIASCYACVGFEQSSANARLIAAAPDLLEALERLLEDYQSLSDSGDAGFLCIEVHPVGKAAYAAIARAKGEGK